MTIGMYVRKRMHIDCRQSSYRRLDCFRTAFRAYHGFRLSRHPFTTLKSAMLATHQSEQSLADEVAHAIVSY
jgi:hypothetical protein